GKDALDLHLRAPGASSAGLTPQWEALDRVAGTLGLLGLGVPRRVVQDQRTAINDVISGQRKGNEETLLDIAGALLYVEAALDDQVDRLGREDASVPADAPVSPAALAAPAESRKLLEVLVKEAIVNFGDARQAFVAFVETHWDHAQLAEVPRLLTEVSGALRILNLTDPSEYLVASRRGATGAGRACPGCACAETRSPAACPDPGRGSAARARARARRRAGASRPRGRAARRRSRGCRGQRRRARVGLRQRRQRGDRRRDPRGLPRGIRRRNREPVAIAAALAQPPGERG